MSNKSLIIEERSRDIGAFIVGRLLPFRSKRMIGPFIFVDHMGPTKMGGEKQMNVNQHPHIGLATLTYLIEGEVMHADSIGTVQRITPGEVNLMVAGSGVTHTERTPKDLVGKEYTMHGYQIWIALPADKEECAPEFHHFKREALPQWTENGLELTLIAGTAFGKTAPVPTQSHLFMVEVKNKAATHLNLAGQFKGEIGIMVTKGGVKTHGETIEAGNLLASKEEDECEIELLENSHVFLLGGTPFAEKRFIDWNFVSADLDRIKKAKKNWDAKNFPKVPNDDTYVPYP